MQSEQKPVILNLGCGVKTAPQTVNIDWTIYLRIAKNPVLSWLARRLLSPARLKNLDRVGENIMVYNLQHGIPYPDNSVDAIYHSHLLEHIDRDIGAPKKDPAVLFLAECRRVLRKGGVLRIAVPDLEKRCVDYINDIKACEGSTEHWAQHDYHVGMIIGQSAMKMMAGTAKERPFVRWLEMKLLGDARARGLTHQWEYDRFNLAYLLKQCGFATIANVDFTTSGIAGWNDIGLDRGDNGGEYKPFSLYMEATK